MKKMLCCMLAFICTVLMSTSKVMAVGSTPLAGDNDSWIIYAALALVAAVTIIVLVVTGKRRK